MNTDQYFRKAKVLRVVDGDTVQVSVDLGFDVWVTHKFRLARINTPEKHEEGWLAATAYTKALEGKDIIIQSIKSDKYGRYLGEIFIGIGDNQFNFNDMLLQAGLAKPYKG